jgi:hypothetical protein
VPCRKLVDITHAAKLKKLTLLHMSGCSGITELSALSNFHTLESLWIQTKTIPSCRPLAAMKSLTSAKIIGEIADKDLSPFLKSQTLQEVDLIPFRRSYLPRLTADELNEKLAARKR